MIGAARPGSGGVLLDTVALIFALEEHPRHDSMARTWLRDVAEGSVRGVIASVAITELFAHPYARGAAEYVERTHAHLRDRSGLEIVSLSPDIARHAARLRARHGLRTPDAVHGATALAAGVDSIVTNDRHFSRMEAEGVDVWFFDDHGAPKAE